MHLIDRHRLVVYGTRDLRGHANAQEVEERHVLPRRRRLTATGIDGVELPPVTNVTAATKAMAHIHS